VNTVGTNDMSYGRQENEAIMSASREYSFRASEETRKRAPFEWRGLDLDRTGIP